MKKLLLILAISLTSLSTFAQSTVKTIRMADPSAVIGINIPIGTLVIDLASSEVYTATAGIFNTFSITSALAEATPLLKKLSGTVFSVTDELSVTTDAASAVVTLSSLVYDTTASDQFKVYLNGTLLPASGYAYALDGTDDTIVVSAAVYVYDVVSVTYSSFE